MDTRTFSYHCSRLYGVPYTCRNLEARTKRDMPAVVRSVVRTCEAVQEINATQRTACLPTQRWGLRYRLLLLLLLLLRLLRLLLFVVVVGSLKQACVGACLRDALGLVGSHL